MGKVRLPAEKNEKIDVFFAKRTLLYRLEDGGRKKMVKGTSCESN